jgi:hypothetical protein
MAILIDFDLSKVIKNEESLFTIPFIGRVGEDSTEKKY